MYHPKVALLSDDGERKEQGRGSRSGEKRKAEEEIDRDIDPGMDMDLL